MKLTRRDTIKLGAGLAGAAMLGPRGAIAQQSFVVNDIAPPAQPIESGASLRVLRPSKFVDGDERVFLENTKKFTEATGVDVQVDFAGWEDLRPQTATAANVGSGPDIVVAWSDDPHKFADKVLDLTELASYLGEKYGGWWPMAEKYGTKDGRWIGMPIGASGGRVVYRKSWVNEAGYETVPSDPDGFLALCRKLKENGHPPGLALGNAVGDGNTWAHWLVWAFGGKMVDENDQVVINSPETVAGITWYTKLFTDGYAVPSAPTDTYKERDANFQSGKAAMEWQGPWSLLEIQENFSKLDYELASMPLPKGPAGNPNWYGGAHASIYKAAEQKGVVEQAFNWISFLSSDEGELLYCKANGMIPASMTAQQDPFWSENELYKGYLNSFPTITRMDPIWATGLSSILDDTVPPLLQGVLNGQLAPEDMATQVQDAVVQGLRQNGVEVPN